MVITAELPTKPYIRQWLYNNFGDPLQISRDNPFGILFFSLLEKPDGEYDSRRRLKHFTAGIRIEIKERVFLKRGCLLSPTNITFLNNYIEEEIKKDVREYLKLSLRFGHTIATAVRDYQDEKNMPEKVFPSDTIIKDFYRFRRKKLPQTVRNYSFAQPVRIVSGNATMA